MDSCIGSAVSSLGEPILAVRRALKRLNSSGGRLSGCDSSESFLRKAKDVLPRGLFNFFSFSLRSRTNDERFFFSGDDWADLDLCASAESADGRVGDSRAWSSGCGVADELEDFLRVKRDGIEKRHGHPKGYQSGNGLLGVRVVAGVGTALAYRAALTFLEASFWLSTQLLNQHLLCLLWSWHWD